MTPEEKEQLNKVFDWVQARQVQQLKVPLDDTSRLILGGISTSGPGTSSVTQSVSVPATPINITVPAAYVGSIILETQNGRFEVGYIRAL